MEMYELTTYYVNTTKFIVKLNIRVPAIHRFFT